MDSNNGFGPRYVQPALRVAPTHQVLVFLGDDLFWMSHQNMYLGGGIYR